MFRFIISTIAGEPARFSSERSTGDQDRFEDAKEAYRRRNRPQSRLVEDRSPIGAGLPQVLSLSMETRPKNRAVRDQASLRSPLRSAMPGKMP